MVGWARRSGSERDTRKVNEWAGNLLVQQIRQLPDKSIVLEPVDSIAEQYQEVLPIKPEESTVELSAGDEVVYCELGTVPGSFMLEGNFCYEGDGAFGLAFDFKDDEEDYKLVSIDPEEQKMYLQFKGGSVSPAAEEVQLNSGETYHFEYIQEDSVGVLYIEDVAAFTVRLYGVVDKPFFLYGKNNKVHYSDLALYTR